MKIKSFLSIIVLSASLFLGLSLGFLLYQFYLPDNQIFVTFATNKLDTTLQLLKTLQVKNPENPVTAFNLGVVNYLLKDFEAAKACFNKSVKLAPNQELFVARNYFNLGNCELKKGMARCQDKEWLNNLEAINQLISQLEAAIAWYQLALDYDKNDAQAKHNLTKAQELLNFLRQRLKNLEEQKQEKQNGNQDQAQKQQQSNGNSNQSNKQNESNCGQQPNNQSQKQDQSSEDKQSESTKSNEQPPKPQSQKDRDLQPQQQPNNHANADQAGEQASSPERSDSSGSAEQKPANGSDAGGASKQQDSMASSSSKPSSSQNQDTAPASKAQGEESSGESSKAMGEEHADQSSHFTTPPSSSSSSRPAHEKSSTPEPSASSDAASQRDDAGGAPLPRKSTTAIPSIPTPVPEQESKETSLEQARDERADTPAKQAVADDESEQPNANVPEPSAEKQAAAKLAESTKEAVAPEAAGLGSASKADAKEKSRTAAVLESDDAPPKNPTTEKEGQSIAAINKPGKDLKQRSTENMIKMLSQKDAAFGSSKIKQKLYVPGKNKGW